MLIIRKFTVFYPFICRLKFVDSICDQLYAPICIGSRICLYTEQESPQIIMKLNYSFPYSFDHIGLNLI